MLRAVSAREELARVEADFRRRVEAAERSAARRRSARSNALRDPDASRRRFDDDESHPARRLVGTPDVSAWVAVSPRFVPDRTSVSRAVATLDVAAPRTHRALAPGRETELFHHRRDEHAADDDDDDPATPRRFRGAEDYDGAFPRAAARGASSEDSSDDTRADAWTRGARRGHPAALPARRLAVLVRSADASRDILPSRRRGKDEDGFLFDDDAKKTRRDRFGTPRGRSDDGLAARPPRLGVFRRAPRGDARAFERSRTHPNANPNANPNAKAAAAASAFASPSRRRAATSRRPGLPDASLAAPDRPTAASSARDAVTTRTLRSLRCRLRSLRPEPARVPGVRSRAARAGEDPSARVFFARHASDPPRARRAILTGTGRPATHRAESELERFTKEEDAFAAGGLGGRGRWRNVGSSARGGSRTRTIGFAPTSKTATAGVLAADASVGTPASVAEALRVAAGRGRGGGRRLAYGGGSDGEGERGSSAFDE
jgi:hypothetical protein